MPKKPGRPPRATKVSLERVEIRVTAAEKREWERGARQCKQTLSDWIRGKIAERENHRMVNAIKATYT